MIEFPPIVGDLTWFAYILIAIVGYLVFKCFITNKKD